MGALHTTLLMRMALLAIIPIDQQVYAKQLDEIYQKKGCCAIYMMDWFYR
jgi:hypothetical protein